MAAIGRHVKNLVIESFDRIVHLSLPELTECTAIPYNSSDIPTPEVTRLHSHICPIAEMFPEPHPEATILLLIGRDVPQLLKVRESRNGPPDAPWAQHMDLGWVIIGDVCLDGVHNPERVEVYCTYILDNGRPSV